MTRSPHKILEDWLARNKRIFAMWMACHTQEEIAAAEGCPADLQCMETANEDGQPGPQQLPWPNRQ
jgi:hypothetical protein